MEGLRKEDPATTVIRAYGRRALRLDLELRMADCIPPLQMSLS